MKKCNIEERDKGHQYPRTCETPMTDANQVGAFVDDLHALVKRYSEEFNLTTAAAVGAMEIVKHQIISQGLNPP